MRAICGLLILVAACGCGTPASDVAITAPVEAGVICLESPVSSIAFSRTQPIAVARTQDQKLRVLSLPEGKEIRSIDIGDRRVIALDLSQDGKTIALGDWAGTVTVWSTETGRLQFTHQLPKYPGVLVHSPDGRHLATAPQGDAVQILDVATGKVLAVLGSPVGGTMAVAFSRDGKWVATGDGDTLVRIHDAATGKLVAENREFLMVPLAVAFSADGASVIASSGDKLLTFIDTQTGKTQQKPDRTTQPVSVLDVSQDGKWIATVFMKSEDMTQPDHIVIRAIDTWQQHVDWLPATMPVGAGWTHDGRALVALAADNGVRLWRLR